MEFEFAVAALVAGMLTVLAPCMVPVLPILIGGSAGGKSIKKPLVITASLMISIVAFTMLVSSAVGILDIPIRTLQIAAGWILAIFGFFTLFPQVWDAISLKIGFSTKSNQMLNRFADRGDTLGDILIGASLGPVFTSCSPTYAAIIGLVLPLSLATGFFYLLLYALGLGVMLLIIGIAGQKAVKKLGWAADPHGVFKRIIGALFLLVGVAIIAGWDKQLETWLLERGLYDPFAEFENNLRE